MPPRLSVIICSHQPSEEYLRRTLDSLEAQDLPRTEWELLLVDNASSPPLATRVSCPWHPAFRLSEEPHLGQSYARIRGVRESRGEILVMVDDDNVLAPDYLSTALRLAEKTPWLGAWGGNNIGEFEIPPPDWAWPYLWVLALREAKRDLWSNRVVPGPETPVGAGMVVRRTVAEAYLAAFAADERRSTLGRVGGGLGSGEDLDLALTAVDIGLGVGVFPALRLVHLIPASRLRPDYLARLHDEVEFGQQRLVALRQPGHLPFVTPRTPLRKIIDRWKRRRLPPEARLIEEARARGREKAHALLSSESRSLSIEPSAGRRNDSAGQTYGG